MTGHPRAPKVSGTLVSHMNLLPLGAEEPSDRFKAVDEFLHMEGAHSFFIGSRLSFEYGMQIGVFRRGIRLIPVTPEEETIYQPWILQDNKEVFREGRSRLPVSEATIDDLRQAHDPAVHIYDTLEQIRLETYPRLPHEPKLLENALGAYVVILASIHSS